MVWNLSLDPRRWTTFPIWTILYTVFGDPLAYNLVAMSGVLFKAYGMYLFCVMLFRQRIPAWVAGAFYAFAAPAHVNCVKTAEYGHNRVDSLVYAGLGLRADALAKAL